MARARPLRRARYAAPTTARPASRLRRALLGMRAANARMRHAHVARALMCRAHTCRVHAPRATCKYKENCKEEEDDQVAKACEALG